MKDNDAFGDRMKLYEQAEAGKRLMPLLPICVRIDGKGFSKWTKGLDRPYDSRLSKLMVETTKYLVDNIDGCKIGYTQSDEISLVIHSDSVASQVFFDGKLQKLCSVIASMTTAFFNSKKDLMFIGYDSQVISCPLPNRDRGYAIFDARVWNVPNMMEAANTLLWREQDATKNSISMASHHYFGHKKNLGLTGAQKQEMLFAEKGVNWNDYPTYFKRGVFVQKRSVFRNLTQEELNKIPEEHRPTEPVQRSEVVELDMPPFGKVVNRTEVIFLGDKPLTIEDIR